jgi:hypothetical protein
MDAVLWLHERNEIVPVHKKKSEMRKKSVLDLIRMKLDLK